ncbi:MAG: MafI family immunity protein [Acidobacteriota bacterium]
MLDLLEDLRPRLSDHDYKLAVDYAEHDEWGLAIEEAVFSVIEEEIELTPELWLGVKKICDQMEVHPDIMRSLAKQMERLDDA